MFGKTLDARSYTTLLLVVIAVLLALNLFGQRVSLDDPNYAGSISRGELGSDLSDSTAIMQVAKSTDAVAESNREIARAIENLARAVDGLDMSVTVNTAEESSSGQAGGANVPATVEQISPSGETTQVPVTEGDDEVPPDEDFEYEGTLNIR